MAFHQHNIQITSLAAISKRQNTLKAERVFQPVILSFATVHSFIPWSRVYIIVAHKLLISGVVELCVKIWKRFLIFHHKEVLVMLALPIVYKLTIHKVSRSIVIFYVECNAYRSFGVLHLVIAHSIEVRWILRVGHPFVALQCVNKLLWSVHVFHTIVHFVLVEGSITV